MQTYMLIVTERPSLTDGTRDAVLAHTNGDLELIRCAVAQLPPRINPDGRYEIHLYAHQRPFEPPYRTLLTALVPGERVIPKLAEQIEAEALT